MTRSRAKNARLRIAMNHCDASVFEGNFCQLEFNVVGSNLRRSEFNDSAELRGTIVQTDLIFTEMNRSNLSGLVITDCATAGLETEDSTGVDDGTEDEIRNLFDDEDEEE